MGLSRCRVTHTENKVAHIRPGTEGHIPEQGTVPSPDCAASFPPWEETSQARGNACDRVGLEGLLSRLRVEALMNPLPGT